MDPNNINQPQAVNTGQPTQTPVVTPPDAPAAPPPSPANMPTPVAPAAPLATPQQPSDSIVTPSGSSGFMKKFIIFIIVLLIVGGAAAAGYFYLTGQSEDKEVMEETTEAKMEPVVVEVPTDEADFLPENIAYTDDVYNFSIEYLSSWDFECLSCNALPVASDSAEWIILETKTSDYFVDEEDKIISGAMLTVKARSTENGADSMQELVLQDVGYATSTFNKIPGALNLDPSLPTQGFIYNDETSGYDIQLEWKSVSMADNADKELQEILSSFKQL